METKYDYIISGNKNTLDTLQAHVVLIKKFYDGTLYTSPMSADRKTKTNSISVWKTKPPRPNISGT